MAYSTEDDILTQISQAELAQLTSESDDAVDHDVVDKAIADADAEIDGYVAVRYAVPLDPVPALIGKLSARIALYNLFSRRSNRLGEVNETVKDNYDRAVKVLESISKGSVTLGVASSPAASSGEGSRTETPTRKFTSESMEGF
jgi:phage gp36-like protein